MIAMQEEQRYNGWTNYPTWCINLWCANDEGLYNLVREQARECIANASDDDAVDRDTAAYELAQWLAESLCELGGDYGLVPEIEGFPADLMSWALGAVDWREIAEHWIADELED